MCLLAVKHVIVRFYLKLSQH